MNIVWKGTPNYTKGRFLNGIKFIVIHWIVGTLESANQTFQNPKRKASAHYGIGDGDIFQWVKESDTAWHAGNWVANLRSIGIEHEGGPSIPITEATYKTSAKLIADICRRYNIVPSLETIVPHKKFSNTQCPGTINLERLIYMVKQELLPLPPAPTPPSTGFPKKVTVQVNGLRVRKAPNTQSAIVTQPTYNGMLNKGDTFTAVDLVDGENISGDNKWYKSSRGNYVSHKYCN